MVYESDNSLMGSSDSNADAIEEIISRALSDESYKEKLLNYPDIVLSEYELSSK